MRFLAAGVGALLLAAAQANAAPVVPPPVRIVSLNLCADSILVELVPHERIAAISHYSRDPYRSTIAPLAQTLPIVYETAEEVVALKPDLVLTSRHSAIATRHALRRIGIRFQLWDVPRTIAESLEQIRVLAKLVHREPQGEALVARIEQAIAAAAPPAGSTPLTAAIYQPEGLTSGAKTVTGQLMRVAGLDNVAARYGVDAYQPLPLELLVSDPPQVLLVGETTRGAPTQAERVVQHRALRTLAAHMNRETFPARLLYCAGPTMIESLDVLVRARRNTLTHLQERS